MKEYSPEENRSLQEMYQIDDITMEEENLFSIPGLPFYIADMNEKDCVDGGYPWHWHPSIQFFYVLEGEIYYRLPNTKYVFRQGQGGFINGHIPHKMEYSGTGSFRFIYMNFLPEMIGESLQSAIMNNYVRPITENPDFDFYHLDISIPHHLALIEIMRKVYDLFYKKEKYYEMYIRSNMSLFWITFNELTESYRTSLAEKNSTIRLKSMIAYINDHYTEKIILEDIAEAGTCSKRECNREFSKHMHSTPFEYILKLRMQKACDLLINTNDSITDISEACGFSSTSYFIKQFREYFDYSPREYRKSLLPYKGHK